MANFKKFPTFLRLMKNKMKTINRNKVHLEKFTSLPLKQKNSFMSPNCIYRCKPVTQYCKSDYHIQNGVEGAMTAFIRRYYTKEGAYVNAPTEEEMKKIIWAILSSPGSFGVSTKRGIGYGGGRYARLVCCFCNGFMSHLKVMMDPICKNHIEYQNLKSNNKCNIYDSLNDFKKHLQEESMNDMYHYLYLQFLKGCTDNFKFHIFNEKISVPRVRSKGTRKTKRKFVKVADVSILYDYINKNSKRMYKIMDNNK